MRTLAAVIALLALPAAAHAGGWANTTLSPASPPRATVGDTWTVDMKILQHGRTPMTGLRPAIIVTRPGGRERRFAARATAKTGVYRARVRLQQAGRHTYRIDDGFTNAVPHKYPPIVVRPAVPAASRQGVGGTGPVLWIAGAVILLAAATTAGVRTRNARRTR